MNSIIKLATTASLLIITLETCISYSQEYVSSEVRNDIKNEVLLTLPEFSDQLLHQKKVEKFFNDGLTPELIAEAVDNVLPSKVSKSGRAVQMEDESALISLDPVNGRVRYASHERSYKHGISLQIPVDVETAKDISLTAACFLGIPGDEIERIIVDRVMVSASAPGAPVLTYPIESLVTMYRTVTNLEVSGSMVRMAISNQGEISRVLIRWPDFFLATNQYTKMKSEDELVNEISEIIINSTGNNLVTIFQKVAYIQVECGKNSGYVPGIIMEAIPQNGDTPMILEIPLVK